jgi:sugar phosphate isomerase/epimerase
VLVQEAVDFQAGYMADPTHLFIEESDYNMATDALHSTPRDMPNPLDASVLKGE